MNVFSYWEGSMPDYIGLCHDTLKRVNDGVVHTPETIRQSGLLDKYIDDPYFQAMCPAHRADIIRIKLLEEQGGCWVDSDFISLNSLEPLVEFATRKNALLYYRDSWVATNGILIAPPRHMMVTEWSRKIDAVFANLKRHNQKEIPWTSFGADQLKVVIGNALESHFDLGWDRVQLVPYAETGRFFITENVRDHSWPAAYGYMLFNSTGIPAWFKNLSRESILSGKWMISHLFRVALGLDTH